MQYTVKSLPKSLKEIRVEVPAADVKPFLETAAGEMSQRAKIEGFRPGKAPYDIVKGRFGEMAILEEALPAIVQKYFVEALKKENLETVGEPSVNVEKAAPGNDVVFTVTIALLPHITKMVDYAKVKVPAKEARITDAEVEKVVDDLRKMQAAEVDIEREVRKGDKVVVDMNMSYDRVPVDGGQAKDHAIYLDEPYYVPGLNEMLFGMKKGEQKTFSLKFPKDHFNKMLSGKDVEFAVEVKKVQEIKHPEADEAFAKALGQESMDTLRGLLRKNLEDEAQNKEKQRQEIAILEEMVKDSKFDDIPDLLVNAETQKMMHELEHSIEKQDVPFDKYLTQVKKTKDQIRLDFVPDALKRVKSALVVREIARKEDLEVTDAEIVEEQGKMLNLYTNDAATQEQIRSEDGEAYIRMILRNRKVMEFLRKTVVKG